MRDAPRGVYVTGTDTDVGKTRVCAALAAAFAPGTVTLVKLVQTGLTAGAEGDAAYAARLAGCAWAELARFEKPADPWSAALAEDRPPPTAAGLLEALGRYRGPVVVEGSGGAAVPLNPDESLSDVAAAAGLPAVVAVGLRLGCINHARLTVAYLTAREIPVAGIVFVERWRPVEPDYRNDVARALRDAAPLLGTVAHDPDAPRSVAAAAALFAPLARRTIAEGEPRSTPSF